VGVPGVPASGSDPRHRGVLRKRPPTPGDRSHLRPPESTDTPKIIVPEPPPSRVQARDQMDTGDKMTAAFEIETDIKRIIDKMHVLGGTDPAMKRWSARNLAIAHTHLEDAAMRIKRYVFTGE
jgi:hypothetical protein